MNTTAWQAFCGARERFKELCDQTGKAASCLRQEQQKLINAREGVSYQVKNPVVYNNALDEVNAQDSITMILVGDNPGRREQDTGRYLVGPSGKIAESFFNKTLHIDFRKNIIILNKTPIHTPRTINLKTLAEADADIQQAIIESQKKMAALLAEFYNALKAPVWITGYSEMKKNGVFAAYTHELKMYAEKKIIAPSDIYFFRHFSMNQFTIDLNKQMQDGETVPAALARIGAAYRERIL